MVEVKRKEGESFENMLRRFNRRVQQSGVLIRARRGKFYEKEKSKNLQRRSAVRRSGLAERREELRRMGKLTTYSKFSRK